MEIDQSELEYVGFWARAWASVIDSILTMFLVVPFILVVVGPSYFGDTRFFKGGFGFLAEWILPAVAIILFWIARGATPGKMAVSARIVDASNGQPASVGQLVGRYLGYYVSAIPLLLGFIWIAFDRRKQGWHDKLAGTVVVRPKKRGSEPVRFNQV